MLIANKIEIPSECPENCPEKNIPFYQGNLCSRCPIFNCRKVPIGDQNGQIYLFCLIEPKDYREDWALEFEKWFKTGMKEYPVLSLAARGSK